MKNENYLHFRIYRNLAATRGEHENDRLHEYAAWIYGDDVRWRTSIP